MEEKNILSAITDTLTGKPVYKLTVPVKWLPLTPKPKRSFWDWLTRKPLPEQPEVETERTLIFAPCVVANQYRVAGAAAQLPEELFEDQSYNLRLLSEHQPTIVYIIAAAIQNNHLEPEQELITFIERNLDGLDLVNALVASFQSLNMEAFTNSIVLMRGTVTILKLKTSPDDGSELIASHMQQSSVFANTPDGANGT